MMADKNLSSGKKAVVLLSGGLDSAVTLYGAKRKGFRCFCLIFDYGQRHRKEIASAKKIAQAARCPYRLLKINLPWKGSSLLDKKIKLPIILRQAQDASSKDTERSRSANGSTTLTIDTERSRSANGSTTLTIDTERSRSANYQLPITIPSTYVPARNIIFLSFALSYAEAIDAEAIFIGAHIQDYSGYPDCRPEFYQAFSQVIVKGTKTGVEKKKIKIITPLIRKTKAQIIKLGKRLEVPFELTWSCYHGGGVPCGKCDSCYYRQKGFAEADLKDPLFRDVL